MKEHVFFRHCGMCSPTHAHKEKQHWTINCGAAISLSPPLTSHMTAMTASSVVLPKVAAVRAVLTVSIVSC